MRKAKLIFANYNPRATSKAPVEQGYGLYVTLTSARKWHTTKGNRCVMEKRLNRRRTAGQRDTEICGEQMRRKRFLFGKHWSG